MSVLKFLKTVEMTDEDREHLEKLLEQLEGWSIPKDAMNRQPLKGSIGNVYVPALSFHGPSHGMPPSGFPLFMA